VGKTYRVSLWNSSGTRLAVVDLTATVTGAQTASFSTAYPLTPATNYTVSYWEINSTNGMYEAACPSANEPVLANPLVTISSMHLFNFGDTMPNSSSGGFFPVEPVLSE
jgi:hypothetical protein